MLTIKQYWGSPGFGESNTNFMFSYSKTSSGSVGSNTGYYEIRNSETIKLYVCNSSIDTYKNSDGWKTYANFIYSYENID